MKDIYTIFLVFSEYLNFKPQVQPDALEGAIGRQEEPEGQREVKPSNSGWEYQGVLYPLATIFEARDSLFLQYMQGFQSQNGVFQMIVLTNMVKQQSKFPLHKYNLSTIIWHRFELVTWKKHFEIGYPVCPYSSWPVP